MKVFTVTAAITNPSVSWFVGTYDSRAAAEAAITDAREQAARRHREDGTPPDQIREVTYSIQESDVEVDR